MDVFFPTLFRTGKRRLIHEDMKHHPEGLDQRVKTNFFFLKTMLQKMAENMQGYSSHFSSAYFLRMCIGDGLIAEQLNILKFHFPYHHINIFNAISVFLLQ